LFPELAMISAADPAGSVALTLLCAAVAFTSCALAMLRITRLEPSAILRRQT
jgi:hypothetical protein